MAFVVYWNLEVSDGPWLLDPAPDAQAAYPPAEVSPYRPPLGRRAKECGLKRK